MMGSSFGAMMGGGSWVGSVTWILVTVDLALLGIWLWKQINKR